MAVHFTRTPNTDQVACAESRSCFVAFASPSISVAELTLEYGREKTHLSFYDLETSAQNVHPLCSVLLRYGVLPATLSRFPETHIDEENDLYQVYFSHMISCSLVTRIIERSYNILFLSKERRIATTN